MHENQYRRTKKLFFFASKIIIIFIIMFYAENMQISYKLRYMHINAHNFALITNYLIFSSDSWIIWWIYLIGKICILLSLRCRCHKTNHYIWVHFPIYMFAYTWNLRLNSTSLNEPHRYLLGVSLQFFLFSEEIHKDDSWTLQAWQSP